MKHCLKRNKNCCMRKDTSILRNSTFYQTNCKVWSFENTSSIYSPVMIAISWRIAFFSSPKPGHLTTATFSNPFSLLRTSVEYTVCDTSSAIINKGTLNCVIFSSKGSISWTSFTRWSVKRTLAFSNSISALSWFVMKCGETYPLSICKNHIKNNNLSYHQYICVCGPNSKIWFKATSFPVNLF